MSEIKKNIQDTLKLYKERILKKHLIIFCVMFFVSMLEIKYLISVEEVKEMLKTLSMTVTLPEIILNEIVMCFVLLFVGIIPYVKIGYITAPFLAMHTALRTLIYFDITPLTIISLILKLIAYSLLLTHSTLICENITLKWKKSNMKQYNIIDARKDISILRKKENKAEKLEKEKEDKLEKILEEIKTKKFSFDINVAMYVIAVVITTIAAVIV